MPRPPGVVGGRLQRVDNLGPLSRIVAMLGGKPATELREFPRSSRKEKGRVVHG